MFGLQRACQCWGHSSVALVGKELTACWWAEPTVSPYLTGHVAMQEITEMPFFLSLSLSFFFSWRVVHTCEIQQNTTERWSGRTAEVCGVIRPEKHGRHMIVILTLYVHCLSSSEKQPHTSTSKGLHSNAILAVTSSGCSCYYSSKGGSQVK